jgi:beta-glucosidase
MTVFEFAGFINPHFRGFIKPAVADITIHMKTRLTSMLMIIIASIIARADDVPSYRTESNIPYCTVNGETLTLNAFVPADAAGPIPAMVDIHGGWWSSLAAASAPAGVGGWQIFMRHHLAIFSINYRLGSDGGFPENIRDCRNAIRFIRKNATRFNIDPNRIDVCGGSAGGHLSLMVAMAPDDFPDGGAAPGLDGISAKVSGSFSYIPPTDFVRFWDEGPDDIVTNNMGVISFRGPENRFPNDSRPRFRILFHGMIPDTAAHRSFYTEMCPIGQVRKDVPPLLICDGEKDPIVSGLEGKELYERLQAAGADATYWMTPGGGHGFPGGPGFDDVLDHFVVRTLAASPSLVRSDSPDYQNPNLPVDERVRDLVGRMTVEEKARQLDMYFGAQDFLTADQRIDKTRARSDAVFNPELAEKAIGTLGVGSIHDIYPPPRLYNAIQAWVIKSNRLGIPALFIEEGLHGYMAHGETVFPQSVNLAATWNPELARETGAAIASEARADGVDMILAPVLDVARDPRWGRVEEDFGEDPFLSGQMGLNYVEGMQGDSLASDHNCIAEPKHFAAHGSPESGLNTSPVHAGEREVRTVMLKTFEPAIREGHAMGIMAAYHDIDGVPCTGNPWLLNSVLRDEWGFKGFVLSDLGAIGRLYVDHHVAATPADAVVLAIKSGVDMQFYDFPHEVFQNALIEGVKNGKLSEATLDTAVSRVLRAKFMLGLFDHRFVDPDLDPQVRRSPEHLALSLEVARQSMCLLKNESNLLPLKREIRCIAVIGTNANIARLGDYADAAKESGDYGMLNQIKKLVSPSTRVLFSDGGNIRRAVRLAKKADVVVLGLGEWHGVSGEGSDRSDLDLPGDQEALLEAVVKTGKPVVLVLQNGRALSISWAAQHVPAILEAWYPGEFGGQAIAETLFGDNNPAGRQPVSFPRSVGQLPVYYNHFPSKTNHYINGDDSPLFSFGYGLSYTTFKYDHLTVAVPAAGSGGDVVVSFDLTNTGNRDGDEVAQAYVRETTASVATPIKALKAFSRVHLKAGETKSIALHIKQSDLEVWGAERQWELEPGEFTVTVGSSSSADLSTRFDLN